MLYPDMILDGDERRLVEADFVGSLTEGAAAAQVVAAPAPSVQVLSATGDDVTADFVDEQPSAPMHVPGTTLVRWWKKARIAGKQPPGDYQLRIRASLDNGERPTLKRRDGQFPVLRIL